VDLRLTLRWASPSHFRLTAADAAGRTRWDLFVAGETSIWIDPERPRPCRVASDRRALDHALTLGLPVRDVAAVLAGKLPSPPASGSIAADGRFEFHDEEGRRWTGDTRGGSPVRWTLWDDGRPEVWLALERGGFVLSAPLAGAQLHWRLIAREPLADPASAAPPSDLFSADECGDARNP